MQLLMFPEIFSRQSGSGPWHRLAANLPGREHLWTVFLARQTRQPWGQVRLLLPAMNGDKHAGTVPHVFSGRIAETLNSIELESGYLLIHNARFLTTLSSKVFDTIAGSVDADVITIQAAEDLSAFYETALVTDKGDLAGVSRPYYDGIEPRFEAAEPPHHILIHHRFLAQQTSMAQISDIDTWLNEACRAGARCLHFGAAGTVQDMVSEKGILGLLSDDAFGEFDNPPQHDLHESVRVGGTVLWGQNVEVARDVILTGPAVLCDGVRIQFGAIVKNSVIGPGVEIASNKVIRNRVIWTQQDGESENGLFAESWCAFDTTDSMQSFRHWSILSYARSLKRIADIVFSLVVLILSTPIFIVVGAIIKLTSPGPVFYPARRQGQYGIEFNCLKFRTMIVQADALQDRLRVVNQVDGPQFKIEDDPRITGIGKFLRDTCIDEIPQFINVLLGQMSVVGPRPSPDRENRTCPAWRDARLSVRPGITGLWQISRTRKIGMDFQEWVYYDMEYVRNLNLWMDVRICVRTVLHLLHQFLKQFG
ncbi:MAG: sugar transferase [Sedimentisphaerales bacterium]|nr:sugar transferase [Sedimentisphaerales bacterium]